MALSPSILRPMRRLWRAWLTRGLLCCLLTAAGAAASAQATDTPPAGYTRCAGEGQTCSFNGTANVVYGARATWSNPRSFTGGTACSNAVFGDPLFGVPKACYAQVGATPAPSGDVPAGYTLCASEGQTCSFNGQADVVYGARGTWSSPRSFTGGTACGNAVFGDPLFGVPKACYYKTAAASQTLNLTVAVSSGGTVHSSPGGIQCSGATCSAAFAQGGTVALTATPAAGYTFSGWSGACGSAAGCSVKMDAAKSISAGFAPTASPSAQTLTVSVSGSGSIAISDGAGSSTCTATCTKTFASGANLALAATPAAGHSFAGWGGACGGTGGCSVKMDAAKSVGATFNAAATGGPLVKWEAPATMANGAPAAGLTGFKVYGSKTRHDLAPALLLTVANPAAVSAAVPGLAPGTWYFWVSATTSAAESELHYNSQATVP